MLLLVMSTVPPQPMLIELDEKRYGVDGWLGSLSIDKATCWLVAAQGDGLLFVGLGEALCVARGVVEWVGAGVVVCGGMVVGGGLVVADVRGADVCRCRGRAECIRCGECVDAGADDVNVASGDWAVPGAVPLLPPPQPATTNAAATTMPRVARMPPPGTNRSS